MDLIQYTELDDQHSQEVHHAQDVPAFYAAPTVGPLLEQALGVAYDQTGRNKAKEVPGNERDQESHPGTAPGLTFS